MKVTRRQVLKTGLAASTVFSPLSISLAQARTLKMAILYPLTGPFAFAGQAGLEGLRDATDYFNEVKGGVGGRKVELIVEDTGYDVSKGTAAFNRIITREREDELLLVYGDSTGLSKALAPEIARLKLPYTATSFSSELADPKAYPTMFVFGPTYNDMLGALLQQVRRVKGKAKVALVYSNSEFGKDPIPYAKAQAAKLGMEIVAEEVTPLAVPDATALALKLRQANPDFVIAHGYVLTVEPVLLKAAREQGLKATFMGTYYSAELALLQRAGAAADGFVVAYHNPYWYDNLASGIDTLKKYRASKGKDNNYKTTYYIGAYTSASAIWEAYRRAGVANALNRDGVVGALNNMGDWDTGGLLRSAKFVDHRLPYTKLYRANVKDARFDAITDWVTVG